MKKLIVIAALALLASPFFEAKAQDDPHWGVEGGLNIAYITGMSASSIVAQWPQLKGLSVGTAPFAGGFLGAFAEFEFTDVIGIRPGISIGQQGTLYSLGRVASGIQYSAWTCETALNVPVLLTVDLAGGKFKLFVGPQFGFALSCKDYGYYSLDGGKTVEKLTQKWTTDEFSVFDLAISVGLQYMFTDVVGISARYNFGLLDFVKNPIMPNNKNYNYVGQIGIVVRIQ